MMFKYMCLVLFITWYQFADGHPAKSDVQSIDSMVDKESDTFLAVEAEQSSQKAGRDKRTIGFLRQLFPNLSQIVDRKIQQITRFLFRVIGRLVLRGGGGAGGNAGGGATAGGTGGDAGGTGGRRISITLPTYPPSADEDEDVAQTDVPAAAAESRAGAPSADAVSTTTSPAATDSAPADSAADVAVSTTQAAITTAVAAVTTTSPTTQRPSDTDNTVGTGIVKRTIREVTTTEESSSKAKKRSPLTDTENDVATDNVSVNTNDDAQAETAEDDPRNKRFLFNLRGTGGGGGGSGNILFDIIRLVAGSGANQDRDESINAPSERDVQEIHPADLNTKEDGYNVGVPGPLTRIFIIANRGVANLVQDLILRLAQTTERLVNFKARLITSLI